MSWKILTKCFLGLQKTIPAPPPLPPSRTKFQPFSIILKWGGGLLRKNASVNVNDFDTMNYQKSLQHKHKQCSSFLVLAKCNSAVISGHLEFNLIWLRCQRMCAKYYRITDIMENNGKKVCTPSIQMLKCIKQKTWKIKTLWKILVNNFRYLFDKYWKERKIFPYENKDLGPWSPSTYVMIFQPLP